MIVIERILEDAECQVVDCVRLADFWVDGINDEEDNPSNFCRECTQELANLLREALVW